jgi:hypothetical protein
MRRDDKRKIREEKRELKKAGNKRKRRFFKQIIIDTPDEAHLYHDDDYDYGKYDVEDFAVSHKLA